MRVSKPKFTLNRICPVCQQASSLFFLTCPSCGKVIMACDEDGTVFASQPSLNDQANYPCDAWVSTVTKCPHCESVREFQYSSDVEIQRLGIAPADYSKRP